MSIWERQRGRRLTGAIAPIALFCVTALAAGCGSTTTSNESAPAPAAEPAAAEEHADHGGEAPSAAAAPSGGVRVFFVEPKEGATLTSPVHFVFGAENITIAAVPEGTVETARANTGHYHLGVEMDCMTPGQVIPKGTPSWVHFGKGDNTFDLQLTPGAHKVALQVGDDLHKTIPGLCQPMTITVK